MTDHLKLQYERQQFTNGYQLVDGVAKHLEYGDQFQIPPDVLKKHIRPGHFVELRIDSSRFSVHQDTAEKCYCPSCHGEASKPILRHEQPGSLVPLPVRTIPARGWGEDFWVRVTRRDDSFLLGTVDNPLVESRLHGLNSGDDVIFDENHILAIHDTHRLDLVREMDADDLKRLAQWLNRSS